LITQKAVRSYRSLLDSYFTHFPPKFLQKNPGKVLSLGQKYRYFELLTKYAKRSTSLLDLNAIRYQIQLEMRKRLDDAKELQNKKSDAMDNLKRYLKSLDVVRQKYEKRIAYLTDQDSRVLDRPVQTQSSKETPFDQEITLKSLLDEYHTSGSERNIETSPGLYYFLEFLEMKDDRPGIVKVRFWLSVSKLR
jgi:hypothetical protein